jgi:hypothetical protein
MLQKQSINQVGGPPGFEPLKAYGAMGRKRNSRKQGRDETGRLGKDSVLELLGAARQEGLRAVRFLPISVWPLHALFLGAKDTHFKRYTGGAFPLGPGHQAAASTHPLFVLEKVGNLAHRVCPCSSQRFFNQRFIDKGCKLEHTSYVVAERTYLVEECVFQVPKDSGFLWSLRYWGRVPECCLRHEVQEDQDGQDDQG